MDFEEFILKTDRISHQAQSTTDEATRRRLKREFFDAAIDYFNEHCTGDINLADSRTIFIGAIEPGPRTKNTQYNETPTTIGPIMSQQASTTSETPKVPSKFAQKLNGIKPSAMDDEKKAAVVGRIKMIGAFTAGVLTTVAVAAVTGYQISLRKLEETSEVEETEETPED